MKNNFLLWTALIIIVMLTGCGSDKADSSANNDESYSEAVEHIITGIEPGAGITVTTEEAVEEYDSLEGWKVDQSSTPAMMTQLDEAIEKKEPIIVTGWNPHWMFAKYENLKYLKDPKGVYGETEVIKTLARKELKKDKPQAYKILDQFQWEVEDMEGIMLKAQESGKDIAVVAKKWVEDHPDVVSEWTKGVKDVDGVEIELVTTQWGSELSATNAVAKVMSQKGFDVTITPVDVAVMYKAVANGDADATVAVWMPITTKEFYEKYEGDFIDLGANLKGAKIGLVVPKYMDIDSIEDLKPAE
ncbi:glycine/betaine ABC transporter [Virgibacillus necropolis]|uniref:Glycine/betaine ABC transporter n=1 Tax=Virgibacillus necropolis TaxID=163877 RepID=A0A221MFZ7_9BACI|nr:glycine/betaine ABC transporter [Virgibacillus necropolis]